MWARFIFLWLLLILLVSYYLVSVIVFFFATSDCRSLQWEKNRSNTVCASDSVQQKRLPVSLEVGRVYFWSLDLSVSRRSLRKKQTSCQCKSRSL